MNKTNGLKRMDMTNTDLKELAILSELSADERIPYTEAYRKQLKFLLEWGYTLK